MLKILPSPRIIDRLKLINKDSSLLDPLVPHVKTKMIRKIVKKIAHFLKFYEKQKK